jgi:hypothetical protein
MYDSVYIYGTQKKCTEVWFRNNINELMVSRMGPAQHLTRSDYRRSPRRRHLRPQGKLNQWKSV